MVEWTQPAALHDNDARIVGGVPQALNSLIFVLGPMVALVAGGAAALVRVPPPAVRSAVQHCAAGVVFAALATELLPDLMHRRMPWVTAAGFAFGVVAMLAIKFVAERAGQESVSRTKRPVSLMLTLIVDTALDGILIGLGFAAGEKQGMLLTAALSLEVFFLGLACGTALTGFGLQRRRIVAAIAALATALMGGAWGGTMLLAAASAAVLDAVLAFGVAALLYLVTEELLVEAHETPETPLQSAMFFVGFLILLILEMLV